VFLEVIDPILDEGEGPPSWFRRWIVSRILANSSRCWSLLRRPAIRPRSGARRKVRRKTAARHGGHRTGDGGVQRMATQYPAIAAPPREPAQHDQDGKTVREEVGGAGGAIMRATTRIDPTASKAPTAVTDTRLMNP
jgi:hypothetical protein